MVAVLIAYATHAGSTADIAQMMAEEMQAAGCDVEVADLRTEKPAPDGFDLVVLGSGIHAGNWYAPAVAWARLHSEALAGRRVAVFNVCLGITDPAKRDECLAYNKAVCPPLVVMDSESFPGRYVPEKVGWLRRIFMRTIQKPEQDHVDKERVKTWAKSLVSTVNLANLT